MIRDHSALRLRRAALALAAAVTLAAPPASAAPAKAPGRGAPASPAPAKAPGRRPPAPMDLAASLPAWRCPVPVMRTLGNGLRVAVFQNSRLPLRDSRKAWVSERRWIDRQGVEEVKQTGG